MKRPRHLPYVLGGRIHTTRLPFDRWVWDQDDGWLAQFSGKRDIVLVPDDNILEPMRSVTGYPPRRK